jgi:hypothetical protein
VGQKKWLFDIFGTQIAWIFFITEIFCRTSQKVMSYKIVPEITTNNFVENHFCERIFVMKKILMNWVPKNRKKPLFLAHPVFIKGFYFYFIVIAKDAHVSQAKFLKRTIEFLTFTRGLMLLYLLKKELSKLA